VKEQHWNLLTILVLIAILLIIGYVGMIFANPYSGWNPLPPPPLPAAFVPPTVTATLQQLPPTWTFTPEIESVNTIPTRLPTFTPEATYTNVVLPTQPPTETPTVTATETIMLLPTRTRTRTPTFTQEPPQEPTKPPQPTNTPVPPTSTPLPPADTPVPPTVAP